MLTFHLFLFDKSNEFVEKEDIEEDGFDEDEANTSTKKPANKTKTTTNKQAAALKKGSEDQIQPMYVQYGVKLPVWDTQEATLSMDDIAAMNDEELATDDRLITVVEIPSGSELETFELDEKGTSILLTFKKHPLSLNVRAIQQILFMKKIVQDPLNSDRGHARRLAFDEALRKLRQNSSSRDIMKRSMTIKLQQRVKDQPIKHLQHTIEPTKTNPLQVSFVYFEFELFENVVKMKKNERIVQAAKMEVGLTNTNNNDDDDDDDDDDNDDGKKGSVVDSDGDVHMKENEANSSSSSSRSKKKSKSSQAKKKSDVEMMNEELKKTVDDLRDKYDEAFEDNAHLCTLVSEKDKKLLKKDKQLDVERGRLRAELKNVNALKIDARKKDVERKKLVELAAQQRAELEAKEKEMEAKEKEMEAKEKEMEAYKAEIVRQHKNALKAAEEAAQSKAALEAAEQEVAASKAVLVATSEQKKKRRVAELQASSPLPSIEGQQEIHSPQATLKATNDPGSVRSTVVEDDHGDSGDDNYEMHEVGGFHFYG